jgi:hypothetical protein
MEEDTAEEPGAPEGDEFDDIAAELYAKRAAWLDEAPPPAIDFKLQLLGGRFTLEKTGQLYDAYSAKASGAEAIEWCRRYGLPRSARFARTLYGDDMAGMLSRWWAAKMQYYIDRWRASEDAHYKYTDADFAAFVEPPEVATYEATATAKQLLRFAQLRELKPGSGASGSGGP